MESKLVRGRGVLWGTVSLAAAILLGATAIAAENRVSHGLSAFGELKYPADFHHFGYVEPDAPKGGTLSLITNIAKTTFDSLNDFILAGEAPQGIDNYEPRSLVYDSLMTRAWDEPDAVYGLVAESAEVAADRSWVTFKMRPEARWHDGTPITAHDVVFTFHVLKEKGDPRYAINLRDVEEAKALGRNIVRFSFNPNGTLRDLPMRVALLPILSKAYFEANPFEEPSLEPPMTSGPYRFGKISPGRAITYDRVADYWGKDLPVNRGRHNFDHVRFEYFRDRSIGMEAFLAGAYDLREEFTSKTWATKYRGPAVEASWIVRDTIPDNRPSGAQAFFFNLRRSIFQDARVRRALDLAFDYEWTNRAIFYGAYKRTSSMFENSELAAEGAPSEAELEMLEPLRDQVPAKVFGEPYKPPLSDGSGTNRDNLRRAAGLLREAGWRVRDGVLTSAEGEAFEIEILSFEPGFNRVFLPYIDNLKRLGIRAEIRMVDSAQYQRRVEEFDFDITTRRLSMPLTPGIEQRNYWSSMAADINGGLNIGGIKNPAIDALIEAIIEARDRPSIVVAARALDRVIMHNHYVIPQWNKGSHTLAWWDKFGRPAMKPRYARGIVDLWWYDAEKAAAIEAAKNAR